MKNRPVINKKPNKKITGNNRTPIFVDFVCNLSQTKCMHSEPQTSRFRRQNRQKKRPGNRNEQNTFFWSPRFPKSSQTGIPSSPSCVVSASETSDRPLGRPVGLLVAAEQEPAKCRAVYRWQVKTCVRAALSLHSKHKFLPKWPAGLDRVDKISKSALLLW